MLRKGCEGSVGHCSGITAAPLSLSRMMRQTNRMCSWLFSKNSAVYCVRVRRSGALIGAT